MLSGRVITEYIPPSPYQIRQSEIQILDAGVCIEGSGASVQDPHSCLDIKRPSGPPGGLHPRAPDGPGPLLIMKELRRPQTPPCFQDPAQNEKSSIWLAQSVFYCRVGVYLVQMTSMISSRPFSQEAFQHNYCISRWHLEWSYGMVV